jgi:predicted metal-dependent hydrolase
MGLGGLKKQEMDKNISIDGFIEGANTHSLQKESKAKYIRQTFSLTQDVSDQIDELLVKSRVARANRSMIIKTAIQQLTLLSEEELNLAVLKTKNDEF